MQYIANMFDLKKGADIHEVKFWWPRNTQEETYVGGGTGKHVKADLLGLGRAHVTARFLGGGNPPVSLPMNPDLRSPIG